MHIYVRNNYCFWCAFGGGGHLCALHEAENVEILYYIAGNFGKN